MAKQAALQKKVSIDNYTKKCELCQSFDLNNEKTRMIIGIRGKKFLAWVDNFCEVYYNNVIVRISAYR